jgi:hypothetical protein
MSYFGKSSSNGGSLLTSPSYQYTNLRLEPKDYIKRLHIFSKVFLGISAFFWSWALHNTWQHMKSHFDFGMVSFFLSFSSSLYLYMKTNRGVEGFTPTGYLGRFFVLMTHSIVTLNYSFGAYTAFTIHTVIYHRFATYCTIFAFLWFFSICVGWKLVSDTMNINIGRNGDVEEGIASTSTETFDEEVNYMYDIKGSSNKNIMPRRSQ